MKQRQVMIMITPPLPQMLDGIVRYAREHEWRLILANRFLRAPNGWNGDGAIMTLREDGETERFANGLERRGIPFVDLTFRRPDISAPRVLVDYVSVGRIAAAHFADAGLRHAAWFSTVWSNVHNLIYRGFSEEWCSRGHGKPFRMVLVDSVARSRLDSIDRFAAVIGQKLRSLPKPAGILALNDDEAARILGLCLELGIQVLNGYGITECSPLVAVNISKQNRYGTVGKALPYCKLKVERDAHRIDTDNAARSSHRCRGVRQSAERNASRGAGRRVARNARPPVCE